MDRRHLLGLSQSNLLSVSIPVKISNRRIYFQSVPLGGTERFAELRFDCSVKWVGAISPKGSNKSTEFDLSLLFGQGAQPVN